MAAFLGIGFLNNALPFCLIAWGQTHFASNLASILIATTLLATIVVAHFLTADEKMTGGCLAGLTIGFCGVVVMIGSEFLSGFGPNLAAQLACLAAAVSYAFGGIFGRRFRRMGVSPITSATGQVMASTVLLLPVALIIDQPWGLPMPGISTCGAIIGMAVLSTALAYVLYLRSRGNVLISR